MKLINVFSHFVFFWGVDGGLLVFHMKDHLTYIIIRSYIISTLDLFYTFINYFTYFTEQNVCLRIKNRQKLFNLHEKYIYIKRITKLKQKEIKEVCKKLYPYKLYIIKQKKITKKNLNYLIHSKEKINKKKKKELKNHLYGIENIINNCNIITNPFYHKSIQNSCNNYVFVCICLLLLSFL